MNFISSIFRRRRFKMPELAPFEHKISSQFGEDGIIKAIFDVIPVRTRYFVEFGIGPNWLDQEYKNGLEGNCVELQRRGWKGLFMDVGVHPAHYGIRTEFITPDNINALLTKYDVPRDVDIISIDVDGQDWWIWQALTYRPSLIVIEYNGHKSISESVSVPLDPQFRWDGTDFYGASLLALNKLAVRKGYTLVFANSVNAFFVLSSVLSNAAQFKYEKLYRPANNHERDPQARPFANI